MIFFFFDNITKKYIYQKNKNQFNHLSDFTVFYVIRKYKKMTYKILISYNERYGL